LELNISTEGVFGHYLFAFKAFVHSYQLIFEQVMLNVLLNHLDHMREKKKKGHGEINPKQTDNDQKLLLLKYLVPK
jgi:hypothetical protein